MPPPGVSPFTRPDAVELTGFGVLRRGRVADRYRQWSRSCNDVEYSAARAMDSTCSDRGIHGHRTSSDKGQSLACDAGVPEAFATPFSVIGAVP